MLLARPKGFEPPNPRFVVWRSFNQPWSVVRYATFQLSRSAADPIEPPRRFAELLDRIENNGVRVVKQN